MNKKKQLALAYSKGTTDGNGSKERLRLRLVRVKRLTGKCFPENDLRENILREKKKRKIFFFSVKCFTDLKSVRHFTEKWLDFPLTRKIFSVDHLFSVKQTPENPENIFL